MVEVGGGAPCAFGSPDTGFAAGAASTSDAGAGAPCESEMGGGTSLVAGVARLEPFVVPGASVLPDKRVRIDVEWTRKYKISKRRLTWRLANPRSDGCQLVPECRK